MENVDFSSALGATNWFIDGYYAIDGNSIKISTTYNDRSSYFGNVACQNMALYFPKAVALHLNQLFNDHDFRSYLKINEKNESSDLTKKLTELKEALLMDLITEEEFYSKRKEIIERH